MSPHHRLLPDNMPGDSRAQAGSDAQFKATFENAPLGVAHVTADGRWVRVNHALCCILGYSADELTAMSFWDVTHPDDVPASLARFDRIRNGEGDRYDTDKRYLRKDGVTVWARVSISRVRVKEGTLDYYITIVEDISAHKQAEDLLRRQAALLDQSHDAIFTCKIGGGITYWSRGAETLYGFTREEAIGRCGHDLLQTRSCTPVQEMEAQIARQGSWYGELTHTTRDGRDITVESRHVRVSYNGETYALETNRDITARKRAEEELRKSEERFRSSLLHSPAPMMLFDDRQEILALSQSWLDESGYSRDELHCMEDWTARAYGERSPGVLENIRGIISTEAPAYPIERVIHTRDGHERLWFFVTAFLGCQPDGRRLFMSVAQDMTERKAREEQVRLLLREVSHRTKNLLSIVQAIARQTAARDPEDFLDRFTRRIQALAANHDLLVRNEWQGVDVDDLVHAQLAHFADLVGSRIAVGGPKMRLNAAAAQAIGFTLHELATNAGKYGALSVAAGCVDVRWRRDSAVFAMSWTESNGPAVRPPDHNGFGSTVIEAMAKQTLGGDVQIEYASTGLVWDLRCPIANALDQP